MKEHFKTLFLLALLVGHISCSDDSDTDNETMEDTRFTQLLVGDMDMELLQDDVTDLVWINDARGCFAAIVNPTTECAELTFAGRSDWRVPTPEEMAELIREIDSRGMNLNYINANCALMSTSEPVWIFTENSDMPAASTMNMPGNAGLRCVTTVQ